MSGVPTAQAFDASGAAAGTVDLPAEVFGIKPHRAVVHQVLVAHLANRRVGTHSTRTRGEVAYSTRKLWRQKGTGRARHGSRRAPLFVGGGVAHGPRPRDYTQRTPRQMRHLAMRSVLSAKAAAGRVVVIDPPRLEAPRTQALADFLARLPVSGRTVLVTAGPDPILARSAANLPEVTVRPAASLTIHDALAADYLVLTRPAVAALAEVYGR
ncbi:MAG: 50S ribosomal protein L4 [Armatimonadota bacterium]|nr:50S ribosomal protein L4 [Armatimonadota bacterium]MDR7437923.1 50S ribosomal protein L4 [Armatimonadota bacterium]MDR7506141.1 50S ribosomal protein L4 [Armatimonadota bacterium]MDR7510027.1 50S ribosomal protein L4 [Armatimonadota bacterium]MDR7516077.1 50S ribosomal protein L4 [Armatimonadota bacterium]